MHRANTLPIALVAFAIVGFLFVLTYAVSPELRLPWSTKATKTTNTTVACTRDAMRCPDGSYVGRTGPSCEFAECPVADINSNTNIGNTNITTNVVVDETAHWKTYTNTTYGFSFKYPSDWSVAENKVALGQKELDRTQVLSADQSDGFSVTMDALFRGETDPVEQFLIDGMSYPTVSAADIIIAGINGAQYLTTYDNPAMTAFIDHEGMAFRLEQMHDLPTWQLITRTFTFTDGNVDLEKSNPIKTISDIAPTLGIYGSAISIMGDQALIGSFFSTTTSGHLYQYDDTHQRVTEISSNITAADPDDVNRPYGVNSIANNGSYWLVSVCRYNGGNYLYKYDGTTWTNLTDNVRAAQKRTGCFGPSMTWNGTDWLFTYNLQLIRYDGQTTFTNVPLSDEFSQQFIVFGATWNGSYYLIPTNGSVWKTFKYDGTSFTALPIPADNHVSSAGWNGKYWLLSGVSNQPILKYDGSTITTTQYATAQQSGSKWLKSLWLVGPYFFDGTKLDTTTPFTVEFRVDGLSLGDHFGLMAGGSHLWRFEY